MASDPTIIQVPDALRSGKHYQKKKQLKHRIAETPGKPEWRYQLLICILVFMEKLSMRLGQIASIWATTILLGGFLIGLSAYDFWVIAALALASSLRIFGIDYEQKLNPKSESRRRTLFRWLYSVVVKGTPKFHIAGSTVVAGILDTSMFVLQLASAVVSLVFSILRLWEDNVVPPAGPSNQRGAIILYYSMVLVENVLFIPAKLGWELPRPLDKTVVFSISYDNEILSHIFEILDKYFMQVLAAARKSTAEGLSMSLRRYISDMLFEGQVDNAAAILTLDVLYQQGEWIKRKFDADKRAKLLPFVLNHIKETNHHQSREAAISLLTSIVMNKSDTPEPSKFGPLVLFRALDMHEFVELMTTVRSISQPVLKYLESCMGSSSEEEVYLAIRVLRKMPAAADLVQNTRIPELLRNRAVSSSNLEKPAGLKSPVSIAALILVALKELGLELPDQIAVSSIVDELVNRALKIRELEILLGLEKYGLLTPEQRDKVTISNLFYKINFMRCLPEIVEWFSSLENDALVAQLKKLTPRDKEWLVSFLQQSRGRYRPDITTLCSLLVKDKYFLIKFEEVHVLRELLNER